MDMEEGIEMSTTWWKNADPLDTETKKVQAEIVASIKQTLNFDSATNRFHRSESFQDSCVRLFPRINMMERNRLEKTHLSEIGVLVCRIEWDTDQ